MSTARTTNANPVQAPSVLDPFLIEFLGTVRALPHGYSTQSHAKGIAAQLGYDPAFIEALFTSAQRRSLIEPFYPPNRKGAFRWRISARGESFLNAHIAAAK
jgi:hypothetical protein